MLFFRRISGFIYLRLARALLCLFMLLNLLTLVFCHHFVMVIYRKLYIYVYPFRSEEKKKGIFRRGLKQKSISKNLAHLFFPGRPRSEVFFGFKPSRHSTINKLINNLAIRQEHTDSEDYLFFITLFFLIFSF